MTNDEQKILEAYRKGEESGSDFILVVQHERLDTGGHLTIIREACPMRIYEVSTPLYRFASSLKKLFPQRTALFLLQISEEVVQIFDVKTQS